MQKYIREHLTKISEQYLLEKCANKFRDLLNSSPLLAQKKNSLEKAK
jgi:hypothetical protein